jgi:hypothetical protein
MNHGQQALGAGVGGQYGIQSQVGNQAVSSRPPTATERFSQLGGELSELESAIESLNTTLRIALIPPNEQPTTPPPRVSESTPDSELNTALADITYRIRTATRRVNDMTRRAVL